MTRRHFLPLFRLALVTLVGYSSLACSPLQAQDFDEQRASAQESRRRGSDERPIDRPNVRVAPPGQGWDLDRDRGRWVLGITGQTTASGVRVRSVVPGSAASRVGLEPGDRIVTVEGFQVGRVGSRHYPLGEELQLRAGHRGDVLLLVQNRRNDQLINLPVQLTRRPRFDRRPPPRSRGDGDFFEPFEQSEDNEDREDSERRAIDDASIE